MRPLRPMAAILLGVALLMPAGAMGVAPAAARKSKAAAEAYANGQVKEAIGLYTEAIEVDPNYAEAYYQRSALYRELGRWDDELEDLKSALTCDRKHQGALRRRADIYFYSQKYLDAELDYTALIKLDRRPWYAYVMRGRARVAQGHDDSAFKDFDKAIEEAPWAWQALYERGRIYARLGKTKRAERDFEDALEQYPQHAGTHVELGKLRFAEKKLDEALKLFTNAERLSHGEGGEALYWRGNTYRALQDWDNAAADYADALEQGFDTAELRYNRAAVAYELGELEQARDDLKLAIERDPQNERYRWAFGRVEELLARRRAEKDMREAEAEAQRLAEEEAKRQAEEDAAAEKDNDDAGDNGDVADDGGDDDEGDDEGDDDDEDVGDDFIKPF